MNHEPPDLDELTEDEQHREVFAWAGLVLYQAQVIEHGLVNLLLMARLAEPDLTTEFPSSDAFYDAHFRMMMGRLLKAVRQHVESPVDLDERLDDLLLRRNFLVHEFFRERVELFVHRTGRSLMLAELARFVNDARAIDQELDRLTFQLGERFGVTPDRVAAAVETMKGAASPMA